MTESNNLMAIVESIATEMKSKYETKIMVESQHCGNFAYIALSHLEKIFLMYINRS